LRGWWGDPWGFESPIGTMAIIVPITNIAHYVRKYPVSYLEWQVFLNPHPVELMLRNHV